MSLYVCAGICPGVSKRCCLSCLTNRALKLQGLSLWVQLYREAPTNFGDLTPNLTYSMCLPTSSCFMCELIHTLHLFMISSEDSNNVNPTNGQLYTLSTGPLSASQSAAGMIKPTINESTVWRTWTSLSMLKSWFYLTDMKTLLFLTCMEFIVWCWGTTMFFF